MTASMINKTIQAVDGATFAAVRQGVLVADKKMPPGPDQGLVLDDDSNSSRVVEFLERHCDSVTLKYVAQKFVLLAVERGWASAELVPEYRAFNADEVFQQLVKGGQSITPKANPKRLWDVVSVGQGSCLLRCNGTAMQPIEVSFETLVRNWQFWHTGKPVGKAKKC